ncbi:MAG: PEP-CTERM sorting domain-containing protein [Planctomycetota bacterium]
MRNYMCKNGVYHLLALTVVLFVSVAAQASGDGYALLIQSSPPDAGTVTPGLGVHKVPVGETVALSAVPKQGYRFLYWLGDVSSTSGTDTTVSIDSPKLVVAVFAKKVYDEKLPEGGMTGGQSSSGGLRGYNPVQPSASVSPTPTPDDDDTPAPGDEEIPEPATVLLLGLGSVILLKKTRK